MVAADSDRIPRVPPYSGGIPEHQPYPYGTFTLCGPSFQNGSGSVNVSFGRSYNPAHPVRCTVWALPISIATTLGIDNFLSFPAGTKMFQFPAYPPGSLLATGLQPDGFPHSDIPGSIPVCRSPGLFAAYHVLLRFRKPRHPPFALLLFLFLKVNFAYS